jgi:hypothetical protein
VLERVTGVSGWAGLLGQCVRIHGGTEGMVCCKRL